jgi:putative chitinase
MNLASKFGAGIYSDHLMVAALRWGITNPEDQARWLAQCSVESAGFRRVVEGMNYRPERLLEVFKGRNGLTTLSQAVAIVAGGQQAIANHVYGGAWGLKNLGNTEPGDGWKFRGMSLIQTTGRSNFRDTSWGCYGDDRLLHNPEILQTPEGASQAAAWYWYSKKLNGITDVRLVTKKINAGMLELDKRIAETKRALELI